MVYINLIIRGLTISSESHISYNGGAKPLTITEQIPGVTLTRKAITGRIGPRMTQLRKMA